MKSFHTTKKLSCLLLGMGMMASAYAAHVECGDTISVDTTLDEDLNCDMAGPGYALLIEDDNITLDLAGHSINFLPGGPSNGILITGNANEVKGPGTVSGFISNVEIEDSNDNKVRKLNIDGGTTGVLINTISGPSANGNHISDNLISNMAFIGIDLRAFNVANADVSENQVHDNVIKDISAGPTAKIGIRINSDQIDSTTNNNQIFHNHIENIISTGDVSFGIFLQSDQDGSIVENNRIENNTIKNVSGVPDSIGDGIRIFSDTAASANLNTVYNNKIEDVDRYGIVIDAGGLLSSDQNIVFLNRINQPGREAIALRPIDVGNVTLNSVSWNFAQNVPALFGAFCDSSGVFNNWGINFDDLSAEFGTPGPCV